MEINIGQGLMNAGLFLGIPMILGVFFLQYKWAKKSNKFVRTLTALKSGGGEWGYAPKEGGEVTLYDKETDTHKTWLVNELTTIEIDYPGVGFVPSWMQKKIRLALFNEGDAEPLLNRSIHRKNIASPDVIEFIKRIAEESPEMAESINQYDEGLTTAPTRTPVIDPATLGSLKQASALKALSTVSNELMDTLKAITVRLQRIGNFNATYIYIGLILNVILTAFAIYMAMQSADASMAPEVVDKIDRIAESLGIK